MHATRLLVVIWGIAGIVSHVIRYDLHTEHCLQPAFAPTVSHPALPSPNLTSGLGEAPIWETGGAG